MKLALGSAQFGSSYGVANCGGKVALGEVGEILNIASQSKVDLIDTAISYGESELALGSVNVEGFNIVTKLPALPGYITDVDSWVDLEISQSLDRLGVTSIYGLLLHQSGSLVGSNGRKLVKALERLKDRGIVKKLGVSIYDPSELEIISGIINLDLVQGPLNIVDRRIISSGWLSKLSKSGVEFHARSVFLQGLLLLSREKIPVKFESWAPIWNFWHDGLELNKLSRLAECLHYVTSIPQVNRVVVGVDSVMQFQEILAASGSDRSMMDWSDMISLDDDLINPSRWGYL